METARPRPLYPLLGGLVNGRDSSTVAPGMHILSC